MSDPNAEKLARWAEISSCTDQVAAIAEDVQGILDQLADLAAALGELE